MSFRNTITVATALSDFHKMIVIVCETSFPKSKPTLPNLIVGGGEGYNSKFLKQMPPISIY